MSIILLHSLISLTDEEKGGGQFDRSCPGGEGGQSKVRYLEDNLEGHGLFTKALFKTFNLFSKSI